MAVPLSNDPKTDYCTLMLNIKYYTMKPSNFRCFSVTLNQGIYVHLPGWPHLSQLSQLCQGAELTALKGKPSMQSRGSLRTAESRWVESQIVRSFKYPRNTPIFCVYEIVYIYIHGVEWEWTILEYIYIWYRYINEYLDFSLAFCWTCLAKIYQNLPAMVLNNRT